MSDKSELRRIFRSKKLSRHYIETASRAIQQKVVELTAFREADNVFCYLSTDKEVSTDMIIDYVLRNGQLYVPLCLDDSNMKAVRFQMGDALTVNRYGIKEPLNVNETADDCAVIIVPCLVAGRDLSRLGHGKGYYDRFLKNSKALKICLCFEECMRDELPMDENDVYMDMVITERNTYVRTN